VRGEEPDDLETQVADDAFVAVLAKLDDFRGASRFTTWVYKFALLEAAVRLRRRTWQDRGVVLEPDSWKDLTDGAERPDTAAERREVDGVPIDVLAERLTTTHGALSKTLHDARRRLRGRLTERGLSTEVSWRERTMARPHHHATFARVLGPADPEILCEECLAHLDAYVQAELRQADADGPAQPR
jgi:RNA polymerase sigma-70 factor (ECF subfamily)